MSATGSQPTALSDDAAVANNPPISSLHPTSRYNWVYEKLVADLGDGVGAFAYIAYKQQKIAFIRDFEKKNQRPPSEQEIAVFHVTSSSAEAIEAFKQRATVLAADFLNKGLKEQLAVQEAEIRDNVLMDELESIRSEMERKRSFWGWIRDVGGNLIVNIGTIFVVGFLITGYQVIDKINKASEKLANVVQPEEVNKPTASPLQSNDSKKSTNAGPASPK